MAFRGEIILFGPAVSKEKRVVRRLIGLVPQGIAVYPLLTAAENLWIFGHGYGLEGAELERRVEEILRFVGLC
jgi:ABC-2 type transport system ATP-binding protein